MNISVDESCDFLIIGSGGASICAALAVQQGGAKAIIVEKEEKIGGSTALSGGVLWVPNNSLMQREGVSDSYEDAWAYLEACSAGAGPAASADRKSTRLNSSH